MNRNKIVVLAIVVELVLLCGLFSAITLSIQDPTVQLSQVLKRGVLQTAEQIDANTDLASTGIDFCQGYSDERKYLYQLNTLVTQKADGLQTFTSQRLSDGKFLRQSFPNSEKFFTDRSNGNIQTTYNIVSQCGGVDIVYTVKNLTATSQTLPRFEVDGITQTTSEDLYVLDTKDAGFVRKVGTRIQGGPRNGQTLDFLYGGGCCDYPSFYYSPVMLTYDSQFAAGSSLQYPYMQYRHSIVPLLTRVTAGEQAGTWKHEYRDFKTEISATNPTAQDAKIGPNEIRTYTVSLRFTEPRSWLFALQPYKDFFKTTYGTVDAVRPQSQNIVEAYILADQANESTSNPRSWSNAGLMAQGWGPVIDQYITRARSRGLTRTMIWAPSGMYTQYGSCPHCNYPSHFMSFLPNLTSTAGEFTKYAQNNIELGFWWGNSTFIPVPDQWNPTSNRLANFSNASDRAFMDNQIMLAYQRGAKTIGLDAFVGAIYDLSAWLDHLRQITNNQVLFVMESSGPDILHRKAANFYHPTSYAWWWQYDKLTANGPDVLSRYLNPGSEIWFQHDVVAPFGSEDLYEQSYSWGYTPIIGQADSTSNFRVSNLNLSVLRCFNGVDDDGDGLTDWPYDRGCADAKDNDEVGSGASSRGGLTDGVLNDSDGTNSSSDDQNFASGSGRSQRDALLRRIQELQSLLAALQAQLANISGGAGSVSGVAVGNITQSLTLGSTGANVTLLQQYLVAKGVLTMPAGTSYGYFGPLTKFALAKFQQQNGISPAVGFFGPVTKEKIKMLP